MSLFTIVFFKMYDPLLHVVISFFLICCSFLLMKLSLCLFKILSLVRDLSGLFVVPFEVDFLKCEIFPYVTIVRVRQRKALQNSNFRNVLP